MAAHAPSLFRPLGASAILSLFVCASVVAFVAPVPLHAADCNGNGIDDAQDILDGTSADCNNNGVPDECDLETRQAAKLTVLGIDPYDDYGQALAIDGDRAVIGARFEDSVAPNAGAAYVFVRNNGNWTYQATLRANEPDSQGDHFGYSVGISGDTIVVGARQYDDAGLHIGAAYVFVYSHPGWSQQAKLTADDAEQQDYFGQSVAIWDDTVVVGAPRDDDGEGASGSVYAFVRSGTSWTQQAKLTANDGQVSDFFGDAVDIDGDTIVVGAYAEDGEGSGTNRGAAYVFTRSGATWTHEVKLTASDTEPGDELGRPVAIHGDTIVAGANGDDDGGPSAGAAYVFTRDGGAWSQQAKLIAADAQLADKFGESADVSGDLILVGARQNDDAGLESGSAYVFLRVGDAWIQQITLAGDDTKAYDRFGTKVAIDGANGLVAAEWNDQNSVYAFQVLVSADCNSNGVPDECDLSDGTSSDFNDNQVPDDCEPDCNGNGFPDAWEVSQGISEDCNGNLAPDECDLADGTSNDCNGNTVPDGCDISAGTSNDIDGNGLPDECEPDCNENGSPDPWEILQGTSEDCNLNSVPDECDLADGTSTDCNANTILDDCEPDCNSNGAPDDCDIIDGTSEDCNDNGIPDECDLDAGQVQKLMADDAEYDDALGWAVAISGDRTLVGSINEDEAANNAGAAYVFTRVGNTWSQEAKLVADDGALNDQFGYDVDLEGDLAVVGVPFRDDLGDASGAVYVFARNEHGWSQQAKILPDDGEADAQFGRYVAISGNVLLVASPYDDEAGSDSGAAYFFARDGDTWHQQAKVTGSDTEAGHTFGSSVAMDGDTAVVGAYDADGFAGAAYVFVRSGDTWTEQAKLSARDGEEWDYFGSAAAINGDTVVIGANGDGDLQYLGGAAYVFVRNGVTWTEQAKITPSDPGIQDLFGTTAALEGDTLLIGVRRDNTADGFTGSAYLLHRYNGIWTEKLKLTAQDARHRDWFGSDVDLDSPDLIIGAYGVNENATDSGAAYVFHDGGSEDCNGNTVPDECDIADGTSTDVNDNGIPDDCEPDCNENGIPDDWDLSQGSSQDCNANLTLDECDIDTGLSDDCNGNIIPDECEVGAKHLMIEAASPYELAHFGTSIGMDGDWAVIGAPDDDGLVNGSGRAYVYARDGDTWTLTETLFANDGDSYDFWGTAVGLHGDLLVIGAPNDDEAGVSDAGSVYVYRYDGGIWTQETKIINPAPGIEDFFGAAVATDGQRIIVGVPGDSVTGLDTGRAYVYRHDGVQWTLEGDRAATSPSFYDEFGDAVAIDGDVAVVGAWRGDDGGTSSGEVFVYHFDGNAWVEQTKLQPPDHAGDDHLGGSVAIDGNTIVAGAWGDSDNGAYTGSASVFVWDGFDWIFQDKLIASDGAAEDYFGDSLAVSDGAIIVGAPGQDSAETNAGAAYVFRPFGGGWLQTDKLLPVESFNGDAFGAAVAVAANNVIVGAPMADLLGSGENGTAHAFSIDNRADCNLNGMPDDCDPDADGDAVPDDCDNCPAVPNPTQADSNDDGAGDLCSPVEILDARSISIHADNTFGLDLLNQAGDYCRPVEGRLGGLYQVQVTFTRPVFGYDGLDLDDVHATCYGIVCPQDPITALAIDDNVLTIELDGIPDRGAVTFLFVGIEDSDGHIVNDPIDVGVLAGDVDGNGHVNIFDLFAVRNRLLQPVNATNFRYDTDTDADFNVFDLFAIRNRLGHTSAADCP